MNNLKFNRKTLTIVLMLVVSVAVALFFIYREPTGYDNKAKIGNQDCEGLVLTCGYCKGVEKNGYCFWND